MCTPTWDFYTFHMVSHFIFSFLTVPPFISFFAMIFSKFVFGDALLFLQRAHRRRSVCLHLLALIAHSNSGVYMPLLVIRDMSSFARSITAVLCSFVFVQVRMCAENLVFVYALEHSPSTFVWIRMPKELSCSCFASFSFGTEFTNGLRRALASPIEAYTHYTHARVSI